MIGIYGFHIPFLLLYAIVAGGLFFVNRRGRRP